MRQRLLILLCFFCVVALAGAAAAARRAGDETHEDSVLSNNDDEDLLQLINERLADVHEHDAAAAAARDESAAADESTPDDETDEADERATEVPEEEEAVTEEEQADDAGDEVLEADESAAAAEEEEEDEDEYEGHGEHIDVAHRVPLFDAADALRDAPDGAARARDALAAVAGIAWSAPTDALIDVDAEADDDVNRTPSERMHALYALGEMYEWGEGGLPTNLTRAVACYERAATLGHADAQAALALLYATGKGVKESNAHAVLLYELAAEGGSLTARMALAHRYAVGDGVRASCERAVQWYEQVALHVVREVELSGLMLPAAAVRLVDETGASLAAGDARALADAGSGGGASKDAQAEMIDYYEYNARHGDTGARVTLGLLYLQGAHGVARDFVRAHRFFTEAAALGDAEAYAHLGLMAEKGYAPPVAADASVATNAAAVTSTDATAAAAAAAESTLAPVLHTELAVDDVVDRSAPMTAPDAARAVALYRAALRLNANCTTALTYLGMRLARDGRYADAHRMLKRAADDGRAEAQLHLAHLYYNGDGVRRDFSRALQLYALATHGGYLVAAFHLALMHRDGLGTPVQCRVAQQLLKRVAERGLQRDLLDVPYECYVDGALACALDGYELAAAAGFEVAQSNAAFLYERADGAAIRTELPMSADERQRRAARYWRASAEQSSSFAHLKMGDAYFYGRGVRASYDRALAFYRVASDMRNAQATFNLGYMQQWGLGVPRDLHLAKRFYDLSAEMSPSGAPAAWAAVALVAVHAAYDGVFGATRLEEESKSLPPDSVLDQGLDLFGLGDDYMVPLDTLLIGILAATLFLAILLKRRRDQIRLHEHQD